MKCEEYQNLIIEEIYAEIAPDDRLLLRKHLQTCPACAEKLKTLGSASQILQKWPDSDPRFNLTFIPENRLTANDLIRKFSFKKFAYGFAGACATLLLILAIGNTKISYQNGKFEFQANLVPDRTLIQPDNYLTKADLEQFRQENYSTLSQIITENNEREKISQAIMFNDLYKEMEAKRQSDLQVVSRALQQVNYGSEERFNQTDRALSALIQYVNYQNSVKP